MSPTQTVLLLNLMFQYLPTETNAYNTFIYLLYISPLPKNANRIMINKYKIVK